MKVFDVVIIGGGIIGASIAYHLTTQGVKRIALIERNTLASAASSQAAGLIMPITGKPEITPLVQQTLHDIETLSSMLASPVPFHQVGCVRAATSQANIDALDKLTAAANVTNLPYEWLSPDQLKQKLPCIDNDRVKRALFFPQDGYVDPYSLAMAYSQAAKKLSTSDGLQVMQNTPVMDLLFEQNRVTGVKTPNAEINSRWVIDAAGAWANQIAGKMNSALPMVPVRSQYWMSSNDLPCANIQTMTLLPEISAFMRPEVDGLLFGMQEQQSKTFDHRDLPDNITEFKVTEEGEQWQALIDSYDEIINFFPEFGDIEWPHYMAGLSSYTPDGKPLIGEIEGVEGMLVATGCSGYGIAMSGGMGRAIAETIAVGSQAEKITAFSPNRFGEVVPHSDEFRQLCALARSRKIRH